MGEKMQMNILKRLNILYVEDDDNVRNELENLLSKLFQNVYTANNGLNGLKVFKKNENDIDIVISDINMPELSGIEMFKAIRLKNQAIPLVLTTAYSDKDFLSEAINIKVDAYIIKPIDVRNLIDALERISNNVYNQILLNQQKLELSNYKDALDSNNIIIKTDNDFNITFANKLFEVTTSYSSSELINKNFSTLKHADTSLEIFDSIKNSISVNISWSGTIKYITKDENIFFVADTYVMATHDKHGVINGSLCILSDITNEQSKKRNIQLAMMKDKGEIFIKSKEDSVGSIKKINDLLIKTENQKNEITILKQKNEDNNNILLDLKTEKKVLKKDLSYYKKIVDASDNSTSIASKANKDNADLKSEMIKLELKVEKLTNNSKNLLDSQKEKYEKKLKRLTKEVKEFRENIGNVDLINEKIIYWREKAKSEARRLESIEKKIIETKDESFLKRIFN